MKNNIIDYENSWKRKNEEREYFNSEFLNKINIKKYKDEINNNMTLYFSKDVKKGFKTGKMSISEKENYENFIRVNKTKMKISETEISSEKEKNLRKKIFSVFQESYKMVKQKSDPNLDTKGIIKNHG